MHDNITAFAASEFAGAKIILAQPFQKTDI
jgi:hypothetical protein